MLCIHCSLFLNKYKMVDKLQLPSIVAVISKQKIYRKKYYWNPFIFGHLLVPKKNIPFPGRAVPHPRSNRVWGATAHREIPMPRRCRTGWATCWPAEGRWMMVVIWVWGRGNWEREGFSKNLVVFFRWPFSDFHRFPIWGRIRFDVKMYGEFECFPSKVWLGDLKWRCAGLGKILYTVNYKSFKSMYTSDITENVGAKKWCKKLV